MRRIHLLLVSGALACAQAPAPEDFVLRVGVLEPIGEVGPEAHAGSAALAGDLVFESLVNPRPGGASSRFLRRWARHGPRRWQLEFEPGQRLSDGSAVTVGDVADSLRRTRTMEVLATSASTLEVEVRGAYPIEVDLAFAVLARKTPRGWLGTGAFVVESQEAHHVVLRRVVPAPGRIARVELVGCASTREAFARLLRGEVGAISSLDRALAELLDGVPGLQVIRGTAPNSITAFFSPRLPGEERRRIVGALPVAEVAAAARGERCCAETQPSPPAMPPGRALRIGYPRQFPELARAAVALRRALGERGGEAVAVDSADWLRTKGEFDVSLDTMLVRPPGVAAHYFETGGRYNSMGYSVAAYDAALASGDEMAAAEVLRRSPAAVVLYRHERLVALDARIKEAKLGDWGAFDRLPEWRVSP